MARPKKEVSVKEEITTVTNNAVDQENVKLKAQIEEQNNRIEQLMKQMENMASLMASQSNTVSYSTPSKHKMVEFINLTYGTLILRGSSNKMWTIDGQFNKRSFTEYEAAAIVNNMSKLINSGAVYINDDEFIEEYRLTDTFNAILSDKVLQSLLEQDSRTVVKLYNDASDMQKKIILDMVINKVENGEDVDANILQRLGKASGKDLLGLVEETAEE